MRIPGGNGITNPDPARHTARGPDLNALRTAHPVFSRAIQVSVTAPLALTLALGDWKLPVELAGHPYGTVEVCQRPVGVAR